MKELLLYGIFGVLATIINIVAYWGLSRLLVMPTVPATVLAWLIAVIFAFWTNRTYVFRSKNSAVLKEAAEFFSARIATGVLDVIIMYLFVDVLGFYDVWVKTVSNILVIILNYILSKFFIFKEAK